MAWVATAVIGSAVIGAGAGIYGANKAAKAQENAANNSLNFQQGVYRDTQENIQPFISTGKSALDKISALYGLNGQAPDSSGFYFSPDYNFALKEGINARDNSAAARGGLLSGNHLRSVTEFGQGLATQNFGNYYNRLAGVAQMGQNAATGGGQLAASQAGQIGNTMTGVGQAQASGIVGGTNAFTGSLNSGVNNYLLMNALNRSSYQPQQISSGYLPLSPGNSGGTGLPGFGGMY